MTNHLNLGCSIFEHITADRQQARQPRHQHQLQVLDLLLPAIQQLQRATLLHLPVLESRALAIQPLGPQQVGSLGLLGPHRLGAQLPLERPKHRFGVLPSLRVHAIAG